ncbi:MAG: S9 family peptidase [Candidatus Eisenbacteria bacterium]
MKPFAAFRTQAPILAAVLGILLLCATVVPSLLCAAEEQGLPPLIPREILFGNPERYAPNISPDGTRLAYLAPDEGVMNVWVKTIGKDDDRVVTKDRRSGIFDYFWAYDGSRIIYLQDSDGDENTHVFAVDLNSDVTRDLTPFLGYRAEVLAYEPNFPDEMLVALNIRNPSLMDVYSLDLITGALELDTENPGSVVNWVVDHELMVRGAQVMTADGGGQLLVRENGDSPWRVLVTWPPEDNLSGAISFTPDGKGLYLRDSRGANAMQLVHIEVATGKQSVLASDPQYDMNAIIVHPRTHVLQAVSFLKERDYWVVLDPSIQGDIEATKKVHKGDFNLVNRDDADKNWIISFTNADSPIPYFIYHRDTQTADFMFTHRPRVEKYTLAPVKPVSFKSRDGYRIYGYLTLPVGVKPSKLPAVLCVHGGPWDRDVWRWDPIVQWIANRGYACFQINFRGSTGYGKNFLNAGDREWGARMHDDLIDGVNWAVKQGYVDPARIGIYGGSYGGYAALAGAAFTPDVFACAIDEFGPSNLVTLLRSIPPYWEPLRRLFDRRVGNPDTEEDFLASRSPLFKADQIKIPLLIGQGANDVRVKQAESEQIVEALRKKGLPVEYILFPDEGHGFQKPQNRLKFYAAAEAFLAKHLGGRTE